MKETVNARIIEIVNEFDYLVKEGESLTMDELKNRALSCPGIMDEPELQELAQIAKDSTIKRVTRNSKGFCWSETGAVISGGIVRKSKIVTDKAYNHPERGWLVNGWPNEIITKGFADNPTAQKFKQLAVEQYERELSKAIEDAIPVIESESFFDLLWRNDREIHNPIPLFHWKESIIRKGRFYDLPQGTEFEIKDHGGCGHPCDNYKDVCSQFGCSWEKRKVAILKLKKVPRDVVEFIKGAFQCYVGYEKHDGLLNFLRESKYTIVRKEDQEKLITFLQNRIKDANNAIESGKAEYYPFDGPTSEFLQGMKRAYSDILTEITRKPENKLC